MDEADRAQNNDAIIMIANIQNSMRHVPQTEYTGHCLF